MNETVSNHTAFSSFGKGKANEAGTLYQLWDQHNGWKDVNMERPVEVAVFSLQLKSKQPRTEDTGSQRRTRVLTERQPGPLSPPSPGTARRQQRPSVKRSPLTSLTTYRCRPCVYFDSVPFTCICSHPQISSWAYLQAILFLKRLKIQTQPVNSMCNLQRAL